MTERETLLAEIAERQARLAKLDALDPLLIEAREIAARCSLFPARIARDYLGGEMDKGPLVTSTLAALRRGMEIAKAEALEAMRVMAEHPRWELSCDCWDTGDWQVYSVDGPRSDREWHLIGSGDTPLAALTAAIAKIEGDQP